MTLRRHPRATNQARHPVLTGRPLIGDTQSQRKQGNLFHRFINFLETFQQCIFMDIHHIANSCSHDCQVLVHQLYFPALGLLHLEEGVNQLIKFCLLS